MFRVGQVKFTNIAVPWVISCTLPGPFGKPLKELPVRHHLLPKDLPVEAEPVEIVQTANGIAFRLGDCRFRYSRLGLEKLKNDSAWLILPKPDEPEPNRDCRVDKRSASTERCPGMFRWMRYRLSTLPKSRASA
jgi:hypothetical protein